LASRRRSGSGQDVPSPGGKPGDRLDEVATATNNRAEPYRRVMGDVSGRTMMTDVTPPRHTKAVVSRLGDGAIGIEPRT